MVRIRVDPDAEGFVSYLNPRDYVPILASKLELSRVPRYSVGASIQTRTRPTVWYVPTLNVHPHNGN